MNQTGHNITVEMVERFQINENYLEGFPCTHICRIALFDGRKVKKGIDGPDIYILIQAIVKEKIAFKRSKDKETLSWEPQTLDHFNCYENFPYSFFRIDRSKPPLPNELLSSLFFINDLS